MSGWSVEKIMYINEWEVVTTHVGIVIDGYMYETDNILSRSIAPDYR